MSCWENDTELWEAVRCGDRDAYKQLYTLHARVMYRYGLHFTNDREEVEDAIHDIFVKIFSDYKQLPQIDSPKAYLLVALRNKLLNIGTGKKTFVLVDDSLSSISTEPNQEQEYIVREENAIQKAFIKKIEVSLSEKEREAIYFRFVENLSFKSIAEVMDVRPQTVQNFIQRAISKMRKHLPCTTYFVMWLSCYLC